MQIRDNLFTLSSIDDLNRCLKLHMAICNLSDLCHYIAILELAFLFSPLNVVSFPSALLSYADCIQIVGGVTFLAPNLPSLCLGEMNGLIHQGFPTRNFLVICSHFLTPVYSYTIISIENGCNFNVTERWVFLTL